MTRLMPASVVLIAVSAAYFFASVSSYPLDHAWSSQERSARSSPVIVMGALPVSKRTSVMPALIGMAVVVVTSAEERLPRISRFRPSTILADREALLAGGRRRRGRIVDERADRRERDRSAVTHVFP